MALRGALSCVQQAAVQATRKDLRYPRIALAQCAEILAPFPRVLS